AALNLIGGPGPQAINASHALRHIVVLMLENHPYDNYFGTYCLKVGPYCPSVADGITPGTCIAMNPANASAGCVRPFNFKTTNYSVTAPLPHTWAASHQAYANGTNANFYLA